MTREPPPASRSPLHRVLQAFEQPLVGYALRLVGDVEAARDVVQDVFLRLCRHGIDPEDPRLGAWLYRVCRNRAIDHLRRERRMHRLEDPDRAPAPAAASEPARAAETRDARARLVDLVGALPARQQEVIWLRFRGGLSYREIGEVCRLSTGNVGFILHTALQTLRSRFGQASLSTATGESS